MAKGDRIVIPILAINQSEDLWGPDVLQFKYGVDYCLLSSLNRTKYDGYSPDRWNSLPPKVKAFPGVYANLLSFLGGPHSCIGYRFALIEFVIIFIETQNMFFSLAIQQMESYSLRAFANL
jgi:hypothetical protein